MKRDVELIAEALMVEKLIRKGAVGAGRSTRERATAGAGSRFIGDRAGDMADWKCWRRHRHELLSICSRSEQGISEEETSIKGEWDVNIIRDVLAMMQGHHTARAIEVRDAGVAATSEMATHVSR